MIIIVRQMKKKLVLLLLSLVSCLSLFAEDVIVLRNGDVINAIVTEIVSDGIKYKKASNPNGPVYTIDKGSVLSIKYANGEIEKFEAPQFVNSKTNEGNSNSLNPIIAEPAEENKAEKEKYAKLPKLNLKASNKKSKTFFPIMAFTDSSVIVTKELAIVIQPKAVMFYDGGWKDKIGYRIEIINRTEQPIYIDRARSFRRYSDFTSTSYYSNQQTIVSHSDNTAVGLGVGLGPIGVGVGNSSGSTYSENYGIERFLIVGPKSTKSLMEYQYIRLSEKKAKFKLISDIEYWGFNFITSELSSEDYVNEGEVKTYDESNSPYSNKYSIVYSTDPEFKNSYVLKFELYARHIVGAKIKDSVWDMASFGQKMIKEMKKTVPDFYDDFIIVGMSGEYIK